MDFDQGSFLILPCWDTSAAKLLLLVMAFGSGYCAPLDPVTECATQGKLSMRADEKFNYCAHARPTEPLPLEKRLRALGFEDDSDSYMLAIPAK